MRTILSNPWLTELTNFFEGDLSFSDIRHILEDENMGDDIKSLLITRVREVTFHEVHSLILSYTEGSGAYYLLDVIKKIQSLSYHEIEDILR